MIDHTSPVSDLLRAWGQGDAQAERRPAARAQRGARRALQARSTAGAGGGAALLGGLSEEETAEVLTVSRATVTRDWHVARAWLFRRMTLGVTEVQGE